MQMSANDMGGLSIHEYMADEAEAQARRVRFDAVQARLAAARLKMEDMPEGDLFIVYSGDKWDGLSQRLMTSNRDKAFEKFNAEVADTYEGDLVRVCSFNCIEDEFRPACSVEREGARQLFLTENPDDALYAE